MPTQLFDIVIPVGPNDKEIIKKQITYTKNNIIGYRNIYLVYIDDSLQIEGCITILEKIFPFTIDTVAKYHGRMSRNGWYLQQLLKLYSGFVIPDILDKYLVVDCDTYFLKPTEFYKDGKSQYNYGTEYHQTYFKHMKKLHPDLVKQDPNKSGICHHMIFETEYIKQLFELVENNHNGDKFYDIFLRNVEDIQNSGASEYEIYFNYMLSKHSDKITVRELIWRNCRLEEDNGKNQYISFHWWMRT